MKPKSLLQECSKWVNFTYTVAASRKIIDQNCGDYIDWGLRDSRNKSRSVMILSLIFLIIFPTHKPHTLVKNTTTNINRLNRHRMFWIRNVKLQDIIMWVIFNKNSIQTCARLSNFTLSMELYCTYMAVCFTDCAKKYYWMSDNIKQTDIQKHVSDNIREQKSN